MWRVMLVDDEEFVRAELVALFPWSQHRFELVAEAESAQAAIERIDETKPDLVITDIRMPEMDGLAFISWLGRHYPQLVTAVVSAYNDFPLVREALRLGAADYLMKAEATVETAGNFLKRIDGILELRNRTRSQQEEISSNMARYQLLAIESFWRDMLTRAADEIEITTRAHDLGIRLEYLQFGLIFVHVPKYQNRSEDDQAQIRQALGDKIQANWDWDWTWKIVDFKRGDFIVIASRPEVDSESVSLQKLQEITCRIVQNSFENWFASASSKICSFSELPRYFKEVREVNLLRLYQPGGGYLKAGDLLKLRQNIPPKVPELLANWERALQSADRNAIDDCINHVFKALLPVKLSPEEARRLVLDLINALRRVSFEHQIRWDAVDQRMMDFTEVLEQAESIHDWRILIEGLAANYLESVKADLYPQASFTIRKALIFIQSNFTRDLSLEEVAESAGVSKSYLSRVFPEYTGEHFSDYLQRLRIEYAKELLRFSNDHIYEISSKVGFWNSRYFSKVFHDTVGMTPADYRRITPTRLK